MKNNWELSYQNMALLIVCAVLTIWLLGTNYELDKSEIRLEGLRMEREKLDSAINASQVRYDSLMTRDSMLTMTLKTLPNYNYVQNNITNDSLRSIIARRGSIR